MISVRMRLYGGPFDGAGGPLLATGPAPETLYVTPDPMFRGWYGLLASRGDRGGGEKYVLVGEESGESVYRHWAQPVEIPTAPLAVGA